MYQPSTIYFIMYISVFSVLFDLYILSVTVSMYDAVWHSNLPVDQCIFGTEASNLLYKYLLNKKKIKKCFPCNYC